MKLTPVSAFRPVMTTAELRALRSDRRIQRSAVEIAAAEVVPLIAVGLLVAYREQVVAAVVAIGHLVR